NWYAQLLSGLYRSTCAARPSVDYVNFVFQLVHLSCHDVVMQGHGPVRANEFVRYTKVSSSESSVNRHPSRYRTQQSTGINRNLSSSSGQSVNLLPCCVTNALSSQLIREAVK